MLAFLLLCVFCIWMDHVEYIDGEWVNTKKLEEKKEAERREKICGGPGKPYVDHHYFDKYPWANKWHE